MFLVWKRASANTWAPGVDSQLSEEKGWALNPSMSMLQLQETSRRLSSGSPMHMAGFKMPTALEMEILEKQRSIMNMIPVNPQVPCKHCCLMRLSAKESSRVKTTWAETVEVLASTWMTDPNTPAKCDEKIHFLAYCYKSHANYSPLHKSCSCLLEWRSLPISSEVLSSQRSTRAAFRLPCKSLPLRRPQVEPASWFYGHSICSGFSIF